MPCRSGPAPSGTSKKDELRDKVNKLKRENKEKERELCKLRTLLFQDDISEEDLEEQRQKHFEHRREDLEHARIEAENKFENVKDHIQKIEDMGGEPKAEIKNALVEARKAQEKAQKLSPEDILHTDKPLEQVHNHLQTVKEALK